MHPVVSQHCTALPRKQRPEGLLLRHRLPCACPVPCGSPPDSGSMTPPAATCHLQCPPCCRLILVFECSRARSIIDQFKAFRQNAVRLISAPRRYGGARTLQVQLAGVGQLIETDWASEDQAFAVRCPAHPNPPYLAPPALVSPPPCVLSPPNHA